MIRCAVLGSPIDHSLSPLLHTKAYEFLGVEGSYERFRVDESELGNFLEVHTPREWRGFSLTMPLKERALEFTSEVDTQASAAQAINTLVSAGSSWIGYNTDVDGFASLLSKLAFNSVAVLGAGGTARAALVALRKYDLDPIVFRRNRDRDVSLLEANARVGLRDWRSHNLAFQHDLLISTVPNSANIEVPIGQYETSSIIDALYYPWPPLLSKVKLVGRYFSGKDLLVAQAVAQLKLFTRVSFEEATLSEFLIKEL